MIVRDIVAALGLEVAAGARGLDREVTGGYASDLLSCVMAGAEQGHVWVTLQAHANVVAVADLKELSCVIITESARPDDDVLRRAEERGIATLLTARATFETVLLLGQLGIGSIAAPGAKPQA